MAFRDDFIKSFKIYLGSRSPRREQLLRGLGIDFDLWIKEEMDEVFPDNMDAEEISQYLARRKADAYHGELKKNDILITADTIVALQDEILMKPESRDDAIESLKKLSGREHKVITGVCLSSYDESYCFCSKTLVKFAKLEIDEICFYVDRFSPYDKAGAYGIQEWIGYVGVESITGSYFNVMGLPVQKLYRELKRFTGYQNAD